MSTEVTRYHPQGSEDAEQARWLAEAFERTIRYDHTGQRWHVWNPASGIWAPDQTQEVQHRVTEHALKSMASVARQQESGAIKADEAVALTKVYRRLFERARTETALAKLAELPEYKTDGADWDQTPNLLGCVNGVVDLNENRLVRPDPAMRVTLSTGHKFVPFAPDPQEAIWPQIAKRCPRFAKFLMEVTSGDESLSVFFLLWFGYSLFGHTDEQKFLILTGLGRNGKGALATTMRYVFGDYNADADANVYMKTRFGVARTDGARADLMALKGKRLAIMSEPDGGQFNEELLKAHTGGDPIVARGLYSKNIISWRPTHTITFLTNEPPKVNDIGPSMTDRVLVADFRERYEGEKQDKKLYETLRGEAEGILAVLCFTAWAWHHAESGLSIPERVRLASSEYLESNDPIGAALEEVFQVDPKAQSAARPLYDTYREWFAGSGNDGDPLSMTGFGLALARKGFRRVKGHSAFLWKGIRPLSAVELADAED